MRDMPTTVCLSVSSHWVFEKMEDHPHFTEFYRDSVMIDAGARVSSRQLRAAYLAWASATGAARLSYPEQRRAMMRLGHEHVRSDGSYFRGAALIAPAPSLALPAPRDRQEALQRAQLRRTIDGLLSELTTLRAALFGGAGPIGEAVDQLSGQLSGALSGPIAAGAGESESAAVRTLSDSSPDSCPDSSPDG